MPMNQKFYGNVMGVPVGSPDDDIFTGEYFPDGQSCLGYMRKGLPSEMALDRITSPRLMGRESGYMPDGAALAEGENENRRVRRSMRITTGNTTGSFTGPPDRVR